jgi:hypothetical protein
MRLQEVRGGKGWEMKLSISDFLGRSRKYLGRRSNLKPRGYTFDARYEAMDPRSTERHCYVHPQNLATHWELNTQDKSYRRPVCEGCAS